MTSPHWQARAICLEKGVVLPQELPHTLVLGLALAQAAGATTITMWLRMTASRARSPSVGTCTSLRVMTADVSIARTKAIHFCHFLCSNSKEKQARPEIGNCASREFMCPILCLCPRQGTRLLTDSHVKLDILVDTQESFKNGHHKVAFDYDENTVRLVEEQTLSTSDKSLLGET